MALAFAVSGCKPKEGDKDKDAAASTVPVEVATASKRDMTASYSGTATLEPEAEAQVVAKASGVLLKLYVEEGMVVKAGQLLAKLDDESARLNLAKAEATLSRLQNDNRRANEMFERKLLSVEQNDKIRFDLESQRAATDIAKLDLSYTSITAPINGVISKRMVKQGNYITLNQALFQIDNFDPLLAVLNVPERELNTLRDDQVVTMQVDAIPTKAFAGHIQRISPVVDPASGTFRVTCEFRDETHQLKSGMFGRLEIAYGKHANALTIPRSALIEEDGETAVFLVVPGTSIKPVDGASGSSDKPADKSADKNAKAETGSEKDKATDEKKTESKPPEWAAQRKVIRIGYGDATYVEVLDGLAVSDRVVTIGRAAVRDGTGLQLLESVQ
ncbi:MAG: efflux RND transporter periplasmic adaptor subunit [Dokdonella sp.]